MTNFSNPFHPLKLIFFFFHNPVEKKTLVQNLCGLYKVYILGSPAAVVWEVPRAHWDLEQMSLFINIFTEEKCQKRQLETTICLCFRSNVSTCPLFLTDRGDKPYFCLSICPPVSQSVC